MNTQHLDKQNSNDLPMLVLVRGLDAEETETGFEDGSSGLSKDYNSSKNSSGVKSDCLMMFLSVPLRRSLL